jgi:hypothetical protein
MTSSLALAGPPVQAPNYDAFSEPDGYIATKEQELAAWAMLRDPEQLEAVYANAVRGNLRATHVLQQLEATLLASGRALAERASRPECLVPAYRELSKRCIPDWSFIDFLRADRPGGNRLRRNIFGAFAERARERHWENQLILSAVNGLISVEVARGMLSESGELLPRRAGTGVERPVVTDPQLGNLVKDLYKGADTGSPIGTGSTADAIRHELKTGQAVGGKLHSQKGQEYARALEKWLAKNPGASAEDRAAAQAMMDDLRSALAGQ